MTTKRTSEGLRSVLFDTLDKFISGEIDSVQAKTIAKLGDSLLKSVAIDLEHKRLMLDLVKDQDPNSTKTLANMNLDVIMVKETPK